MPLRLACLAAFTSSCGFFVDDAPSFRRQGVGPDGGVEDASDGGKDVASDVDDAVDARDGADDGVVDADDEDGPCTCEVPNAPLTHCGDDEGDCVIDGCEGGWADCFDDQPGCETATNGLDYDGSGQLTCDYPNATPSCTDGVCSLVCNGGYDDCEPRLPGCEQMVVWYADADEDLYANIDSMMLACANASMRYWVSVHDKIGVDCWDHNADVHPNQEGFFTVETGNSTDYTTRWDYDCSGTVTMYAPLAYECLLDEDCAGNGGWVGEVPACGDRGDLSLACVPSGTNMLCTPGAITRDQTQACH